eukprot:156617-Prorocentrum_minimum.AAC.1
MLQGHFGISASDPATLPTATLREAPEMALMALAALAGNLERLKVGRELTRAAEVANHSLFTGAVKLDGATIHNLVRLQQPSATLLVVLRWDGGTAIKE